MNRPSSGLATTLTASVLRAHDAPSWNVWGNGREVRRFSYNLLTTGQYDPAINASIDRAELPLGSFGVYLARQAEAFFREHKVSVLIPKDSILVWDNHRMLHARSSYQDTRRHLIRYWIAARP